MKQTQMVRGVVFSDLREARALPGAGICSLPRLDPWYLSLFLQTF
jgi:hypothetical protein